MIPHMTGIFLNYIKFSRFSQGEKASPFDPQILIIISKKRKANNSLKEML